MGAIRKTKDKIKKLPKMGDQGDGETRDRQGTDNEYIKTEF